MQTISWLEAWSLWFSGQEVPGNLYMGSQTIRAWGRAGKILSFIAGATVILDLVGPERLREIGANMHNDDGFWVLQRMGRIRNVLLYPVLLPLTAAALVLTITGIIPGPVALPIALLVIILILPALATLAYQGIAYVLAPNLDHKRPAVRIRVIAIVALAVGFHLDLLAS